MMQEATRAVEFLHAKGYMHCDIKSLNFLVAKVPYWLICTHIWS
jgi:serine/threonine protein kinase